MSSDVSSTIVPKRGRPPGPLPLKNRERRRPPKTTETGGIKRRKSEVGDENRSMVDEESHGKGEDRIGSCEQ